MDRCHPVTRQMAKIQKLGFEFPMKKSIIDSGNGEKNPLSLVRKKIALKDEKRKTMRTQILVNEGYYIRHIKF